MTESPFNEVSANYLERGFSIIPIVPGQKYPGEFDGHRWQPARGWNVHVGRYMTEDEVDTAATWPGCSIGLCPGRLSRVVALDRDYDGGVSEILDALIPPSPVRKVGSKGYTAFYRYSGEITRRWSVGGERVLELLSDGTQTVLPPSVHPGTRAPYYWETVDDLLSLDIDELPALPADFCEQVTRALEPYTGTSITSSGKPTGPETDVEQITGRQLAELKEALEHIPADDRDIWIRVGMALKTIGEPGFDLWVTWSRTSSKYDEAAHRSMVTRWRGFKVLENGVSYRTIFSLAIENGYRPTVALDSEPLIRPGLVGNMARAALAHAQKNGEYLHLDLNAPPESQAEPEQPARRVRTGLRWDRVSLAADLTPPDWLIKSVFVGNSLAMIYGAAGTGKTFCALDLALCVAAGQGWHGRPVKRGPVHYVAGEGRAGVAKRVAAWCQYHGHDPGNLPFYISSKSVPFLDPIALAEVSESLHNMPENPRLLIVDTLNRNFGDGDENSTRDMSAFVSALDRIRTESGACILVVHHTGKGEQKTARGNSALRAALDTEVAIVSRDRGGINVTCTKQKDAEPFDSIGFDFQSVDLGEVDGESIESLVCVLDAMQGSAAAILESSARKVTDSRRAGLELLEVMRLEAEKASPGWPVQRIDRADYVKRLQDSPHGLKRRTAYDVCAYWTEQGRCSVDGDYLVINRPGGVENVCG